MSSNFSDIDKFSIKDLAIGGSVESSTNDTSIADNEISIADKLARIKEESGIIKIDDEALRLNWEQLNKVSKIGHGNFGTVFEYKYKSAKGDHKMAVKIMALGGNEKMVNSVLMEMDVIRKSYNCSNIVNFLGYFITNDSICICMERMTMCFDTLMTKLGKPIPEEIIGVMSVSVVQALDYLKTVHIMHRDIKPSNILLNWTGHVKLCDFGISNILIESRTVTRQVGCSIYMAPERFDPRNLLYDIRSDVWSFGITLVELAKGTHPYSQFQDAIRECNLIETIRSGELPRLQPTDGDGFSLELCNLVKNCLERSPQDRPVSFKLLLEDPFIQHYGGQQMRMKDWLNEVMKQPY